MPILTTGDVLIQLGIYPSISAFEYLQVAVDIINRRCLTHQNISNCRLYTEVGCKFGVKWTQVERAIRHATTIMYDATDPQLIAFRNEVCGPYYSSSSGKISAGEFTFALAYYCRMHHYETTSDAYLAKEQVRQKYLDRLLSETYPTYREELERASINSKK